MRLRTHHEPEGTFFPDGVASLSTSIFAEAYYLNFIVENVYLDWRSRGVCMTRASTQGRCPSFDDTTL